VGGYGAEKFGTKKGGVDKLGKLRNGAQAEWSNFDLLISSPLWAKPRPPEVAFIVVCTLCANTIFLKTIKTALKRL
jgi:hypothetical protein